MKIINVVGARPNFMKIAPLMAEYTKYNQIEPLLVHTGQHYDEKMSDLFFSQLDIPEPDINLEVGSASHAVQTAEIMKAFEPVVLEHKPDVVLVVGDVNSTIACGLVAVKLGIKLTHVEAGLRSFDRSMPEEINRILTDSISDFLFCTEQSGVDNLLCEGIPREKIFLAGNVMVDTLLKNKAKAEKSNILNNLNLNHDGFAVLTLHRPANVDDPDTFGRIFDALEIIQNDMPVIFPIHPRTRKNLTFLSLERQRFTVKMSAMRQFFVLRDKENKFRGNNARIFHRATPNRYDLPSPRYDFSQIAYAVNKYFAPGKCYVTSKSFVGYTNAGNAALMPRSLQIIPQSLGQ